MQKCQDWNIADKISISPAECKQFLNRDNNGAKSKQFLNPDNNGAVNNTKEWMTLMRINRYMELKQNQT
jgi:hypothetical protein